MLNTAGSNAARAPAAVSLLLASCGYQLSAVLSAGRAAIQFFANVKLYNAFVAQTLIDTGARLLIDSVFKFVFLNSFACVKKFYAVPPNIELVDAFTAEFNN